MSERWLDFESLCVELQLPAKVVKRLIKEGKLVGICHGRKGRYERDWRFLDPSEKYKRALSTQEKLLSFAYTVDLLAYPLLATAEVAVLAGLSQERIRHFVFTGKLKPHKMGRYSLYSPDQVRAFLLWRERKEPTSRRARCEMLLRWCLKALEANPEATMTLAEVRNDDLLEGHLRKLLRQKEPERTRSIQEFWRRYQLGKDVAAVLKAKS
jgi:DNA-binding transcriptional MerR regulator